MSHRHFRPPAVLTALGGLTLGLALGLLAAGRASAQANLPPGSDQPVSIPMMTNPGAPPFGGTLLLEVTARVFGSNGTGPGANTISGIVTSGVFRSTEGFLDFAYQFTFDSTTNVAVSSFSIASFSDVDGLTIAQTGIDIDGAGGLTAQNTGGNQNNFAAATPERFFSSATRPNTNGDGINVILPSGARGGDTTFTLLLRSEATSFAQLGSASVQSGGVSGQTQIGQLLTPLPLNNAAAAPEPAALALLASALPFVGARLRRRRTTQ